MSDSVGSGTQLPPTEALAKVRTRTVFYIPGFDPRGPVYYHHLYGSEGRSQAAVNGLAIDVSRRRTTDALEAAWTVRATEAVTQYRYFRYDDIVRRRWPRNGFTMYGAILHYSWHFWRMGVLAMIARNSWPNLMAVTYPLVLVMGLFAIAGAIGLVAAMALVALIGAVGWTLVAAFLLLPFAAYRPLEKWLNAFWLARSCTFLVDRSLGKVPDIEERCQRFADRVADAIKAGTSDEVLIVGHSVGTHLAVTVAARVLERIETGPRFSLLTLGHALAMTPDTPAARQFRGDLLAVSTSTQVDWIDVTSAVDGSCIALSDPLSLSRVARPAGARMQPKLVSARFNKLFHPKRYATIRRDFLRTHFQYLMAAELPGDYDYFLITAGDKTLEQRFRHLESVTGFNRFRTAKA